MFSPICSPMFCTADSLVTGSLIKLAIDSNGKKRLTVLAASQIITFQPKSPNTTCSKMVQRMRKPNAKAERLTKIPKNKQKEKKPTNLKKKAGKNSISEKMMEISL